MTKVLESLNAALLEALRTDQTVHLLGEDILDPYGGAFKVTRGLSSAYPDRVWTTPVSEAGIVGVAGGMALRGLRPVVEIMFGDFTTLIADQLINHAAKFRGMYADQVHVPLVVRTPMGGRRGYGPTHSQTLDKLFLGVPGLRVLAPTAFGDPGALLRDAILADDDPVLFLENKLLYGLPVRGTARHGDLEVTRVDHPGGYAPSYRVVVADAGDPQVTFAAYGHMAELAAEAVTRLAYELEIFVELIVPTQLAPFELSALTDSAGRTGRLLLAEEGTRTAGWGAEVAAQVAEALGPALRGVRRVGAPDLPIPAAAPVEEAFLPTVDDLMAAGKELH